MRAPVRGVGFRAGTAARRAPAATRRWGTAAVEFALIAPLVVMLVLGMIEFSRLMMVEEVLTNAAREGCRQAVLTGSTTGNATSTVDTYLSGAGIAGYTTTVSPDPSTAQAGTAITVRISVPYSQVTWLPSPIFLGSVTLTVNVTMRKETNNT
jgi:Flp pilus assembly protein TadG